MTWSWPLTCIWKTSTQIRQWYSCVCWPYHVQLGLLFWIKNKQNIKKKLKRKKTWFIFYFSFFVSCQKSSLSFIYTKHSSFKWCHFWTEIERDWDEKKRRVYSVLRSIKISVGSIQSTWLKERGRFRTISVPRLRWKRKETFWNIIANGVFRCHLASGVSQLLLRYL